MSGIDTEKYEEYQLAQVRNDGHSSAGEKAVNHFRTTDPGTSDDLKIEILRFF